MEPFTLVGVVIGVIGFMGALAAAVVVMRSSALRVAAETWREEAEAQKARADRLEDSVAQLDARVRALEDDNARLKDLATGATAVAELKTLVVHQHAEVMEIVTALVAGHRHN